MEIVELFYARIIADDLLRPFFVQLGMATQARKQVAFMGWALGGPVPYTGADLRQAHAALVARGLGDKHFNAILQHLDATLAELRIEHPDIEQVLATVETTRAAVLAGS